MRNIELNAPDPRIVPKPKSLLRSNTLKKLTKISGALLPIAINVAAATSNRILYLAIIVSMHFMK